MTNKGLLIIITLLVLSGGVFALWYSNSLKNGADVTTKEMEAEKRIEEEARIESEKQSVEIEGITVPIEVAKIIILLVESGYPECTVFDIEGEEPDPKAVETCDTINK